MATLLRSVGSLVDTVTIAANATSAITKETAGAVIDTLKTTRKTIGIVDSLADYGREIVNSHINDQRMINSLRSKARKEVIESEEFKTKLNDAVARELLSEFDESIDIKF